MKRIKLFESFQSNNPIEVRDDIKSILYELEDNGYDVIFKVDGREIGRVAISAINASGGGNVIVKNTTAAGTRG
jgi:hypothetical protein